LALICKKVQVIVKMIVLEK